MPEMNFKIEKRVGVQAPSERIWEILADLRHWDRWNPIETAVEGTLSFGGQILLTEAFPGLPERRVMARIGDWQPNAQLIWSEKRGWLFDVVRFYEIEELERGSCIVSNGFVFRGFRAEGFHDKHRRLLRAGCEAISEALKVQAEAG